MKRTADAAIVGGGIVGCAIAFELARRGVRAVVIEKEGAAGHGSTGASSGCVRQLYSTPPAVALAAESVAVWRDWAAHVGATDAAEYRETGCLYVVHEIDEAVLSMVRDAGVRMEVVDPRERFPWLQIDGPALFEEGGGYVPDPARAAQELMEAAVARGAELLRHRRVVAIRGPGRVTGVRLHTGEEISTPVVVNAAGPHSHLVNLMAGCPLPLTTAPSRHQTIDLPIGRPWDFAARPIPVCGDLASGIYFRPEPAANAVHVGSLAEEDEREFVTDPDDFNPAPSAEFHDRVGQRMMRRFDEVRLPSRPRGVAGLYDVTVADFYPILDDTDLDGYYVAIGTSGAWFKGGPVIGHLMAELIATGSKDVRLPRTGRRIDLGFFGRARRPIGAALGGGVIG